MFWAKAQNCNIPTNQPSVSSLDTAICGSGAITISTSSLTASIQDGTFDVVVYKNGSFLQTYYNTINPVSISDQGLTTNSYEFIIRDHADTTNQACWDTLKTTITRNPLPNVTVYPSDTSLAQPYIGTITASGALTYVWDKAPPTSVINVNTLGAITYTVTGTDINGCKASATSHINIPDCSGKLSVFLSSSKPSLYLCPGEELMIKTNLLNPFRTQQKLDFRWYFGNPASSPELKSTINNSYSSVYSDSLVIPYTEAGLYTVVVMDHDFPLLKQCWGTASIAVSANPAPSVSISGGGVYCSKSTAPTVNVNFSGTAPFSFSWTDGTTTFTKTGITSSPYSITPAGSGIFNATALSDKNCTATTNTSGIVVTKIQQPDLVWDLTKDSTYCSGGTNGTSLEAKIVTAASSGNYSYKWYDLSTNTDLNNNSLVSATPTGTKTYGLTVTDIVSGHTCSQVMRNRVITQFTLPTYTITGGSTYCYGEPKSKLSLAIFGGIAPWNVTYQDGAGSTHSVTIVTAPYTIPETLDGYYRIVSINSGDLKACPGVIDATKIAVIQTNSQITVTPIAQTQICATATAGTIDLSSLFTFSAGTVTYACSDVSAINTTNFIKTNVAGTYTISATCTFGGCTGTGINTIRVNPNPTVYAGNDANACINTNLNLNATITGGTGVLTYNWSPVIDISNGAIEDPIFNSTSVGQTSYTLSVTDSKGCKGGDVIVVNTNGLPTISASALPTAVCKGIGSTITATGGISYVWSNSIGLASQTVSPTATTSYFVIGTDVNGCKNSASTTITVNPLPSVTMMQSFSVCAGNSVTIVMTGNANYSYKWSSSKGDVMPATASPTVIGYNSGIVKYTCTITDNSTGCSTIQSTDVNYLPIPTVSISLPTLNTTTGNYCVNASAMPINISPSTGGSISVTGTGVSGSSPNYVWNPGVAGVGTYTLTYNYTDYNGCSNKATTTISNYGLPTVVWAPATPKLVCTDGTPLNLNVEVSPSGGKGVFGETLGQAFYVDVESVIGDTTVLTKISETSADLNYMKNGYGMRTLNYNYKDKNGCKSSAKPFYIEIQKTPSKPDLLNISSMSCPKPVISIFFIIDGTQKWYENLDSALLKTGNIEPVIPSTGASPDCAVVGIYKYFCTITKNGCESEPSETIINVTGPCPAQAPTAGVDPNPCTAPNLFTTVSATAQGTGTLVWFSTSNTSSTHIGSGANYTVIATSPGNYTYYVAEWNAANTCYGPTTSVSLTINPLPTIVAVANQSPICSGFSSVISAGGASTYRWNNGVASGTQIVSPTAPTIQTVNTYIVTGTDANGCKNTASVQVVVNPSPTITATALSAICIGYSTTITGFGAGTGSYAWENGINTASQVVSPSATTIYKVTGTDANGCINTASTTVTVTNPALPIGSDYSISVGSLVPTFSAVGTLIKWYDSNGILLTTGNTYTPPISSDLPGIYVFKITNTVNGCESSFVTITLTITNCTTPIPTISNTTQTVCDGSPFSAFVATGTNIKWYDAKSSLVASTSTFTPTLAGDYYVSQTNVCESPRTKVSASVYPLPVPVFDVNIKSDYCFTEKSINLNGSDANAQLGTNIFIVDGVVETSGVLVFGTITTDKIYSIEFIRTTNNGCKDSITKSIIVHAPILTTISRTINKGDSVLIASQYYKTAGTFDILYTSKLGCDSTIHYTITVKIIGDSNGDGIIGAGEIPGDKNSDGVIGLGELAGDVNGDGSIGAGEIVGDLNGDGIIGTAEFAGDINGDGIIGSSEIVGDKNGDGIIGTNELSGDKNGNGIVESTEIVGDKNGDGIIGIDEIVGDKNGDGQITLTEITGDKTGDGIITDPEIAGDIDGNGIIDNGEICGDINGNKVIDTNEIAGDISGNGIIDNTETALKTGFRNEIAGDLNGDGIINGTELAGDGNGNGIIDANTELLGDINANNLIGVGEALGDLNGNGTLDNGEQTATSIIKKTTIKIYPNPVSTILTVEIGNVKVTGTIAITNILGLVVTEKTFSLQNQVVIDVQSLPAGLYIVKVNAGGILFSKKFIKE